MVVGALTGRGTLPSIRVPKNVKVSAQYYIDNILKHLLEQYLKYLYHNELYKVFVHHDKATSHTARLTREYIDNLQKKKQELTLSLMRTFLSNPPM